MVLSGSGAGLWAGWRVLRVGVPPELVTGGWEFGVTIVYTSPNSYRLLTLYIMHLSQLQIFSKKRDASAIQKGYEFQHLKTLKTWLENRIGNVDEWIYCDFEEDIFQRDLAKEKIRLRQVKLYSTNFSFSSEEIQDTIANFFMLYVKGEYMFDAITFSFETNASVKNERQGNDADLLRELSAGWEDMPDDRKVRARERIRGMLRKYIEGEAVRRDGDSAVAEDVKRAQEVFASLSDEVLDHFIGSIHWQFDGLSTNDTVDQLRDEIVDLIGRLPLPQVGPAIATFSVLYTVVVDRSIRDDPEDRKLLSSDLDMALLNAGDEKAQWYAGVYEKWSPVTSMMEFYSGQFYEIVDASRFYRINMYDAGHKEVWMRLLDMFISNPDVEVKYRRKAIYEYLFLLVNPDPFSGKPIGSFVGQEDKIRYYFSNRVITASEEQIREDRMIFTMTSSQALVGNISIQAAELQEWGAAITGLIDSRLATNPRVDERCRLLELKGDFEMNIVLLQHEGAVKTAMDTFREIVPLLPQTSMYTIAPLVRTLEGYINLLVLVGGRQGVIDAIEEFLGEVRDTAVKAEGKHDTAHGFVERGGQYLEAGGLDNMLQALHYFHRAKSLWFADDAMEGHVLALLNISPLYAELGMNVVAKYHALCAIWSTWHSRDESKYNRLAQATGFLFTADFRQGAWVTALDDYEMFIRARMDWNPDGWEGNEDEMFAERVNDTAFMLYAGRQFHPEMGVYFDYKTSRWGALKDKYVQPAMENMEKLMDEGRDIKKVARRHLTNEPLSDIGPVRTISFNALDIQWDIEFENSYLMNAIGEEFTCMLQIFLCEIARLKKGLLKTGMSVRISVVQSPGYDTIKKHISADDWIAPIPEFRGKEQKEIGYHCATVSIMVKDLLQEYIAVTDEEFEAFWKMLHEKELVGEKACGVNPYQKVYYNAVSKDVFDAAQRTAFTSPPAEKVFGEAQKLLV